ncbi:MAG: alanine racemase [Deinococcota bacterium]
MSLAELETPCLLLDETKLEHNITRMHEHLATFNVPLRPHVKTPKCLEVVRKSLASQPGGITVSTLKEADVFVQHGITDILYAVSMVPSKLPHVAKLQAVGATITVVVDSVPAAEQLASGCAERDLTLPVLIEIDSDGHRAGIQPDDHEALLAVAHALDASPQLHLKGVMTHAGESYHCASPSAITTFARKEQDAVRHAATVLREAGLTCEVVSVGSTPTAQLGEGFDGITEVRAGVFVFYDLVMAGLGVCQVNDVALSVLTTVIGHQAHKNWILTDGGWLSLSRDRGTSKQTVDYGYGLVCDIDGKPLEDLIVSDASQEHGIITNRSGQNIDINQFPIGTRLRILPNHACATAAAHPAYQVLQEGQVKDTWKRFGFW